LCRAEFRVTLSDPSPTAARLARDLGAGEIASASTGDPPDLVVVAAPPDVAAQVVLDALATWPDAIVTDVASVKGAVAHAVRDGGGDLARYVGSHPMAGRERSGAGAARGDLFEGRAWVIVPTEGSRPEAVEQVRQIAVAAGSAVSVMDAAEHDAAVAVVSHVPQLAASLVASRLREVPDPAVALAGQGLRDVTRIAASDPLLWTQILAGNAAAVRDVLVAMRADLDEVITALETLAHGDGRGALEVVNRTVGNGNAGHARIPGKHGAPPTAYETVVVVVPDTPGALGRLLTDMGEAGVNLEDLHLDHGLGQPFGLAEVSVLPSAVDRLLAALDERGWRVHD
jgi:prephenate dehydrogenase